MVRVPQTALSSSNFGQITVQQCVMNLFKATVKATAAIETSLGKLFAGMVA